MDSVTQVALGAAIGDVVGGEQTQKKGMLWGAVAGLIPDLDVLFQPLFIQSEYLLFHRGISHSVLFTTLLAPLLAWGVFLIYKKKVLSFKRWWLIIFLGLFTHPLLDIMTIYGTGFFEPFSNARLAAGTISIVDPLYSLPLFIPLIVRIIKKHSHKIQRGVAICLIASNLYLLLTLFNGIYMNNIFKQNLKDQGIKYSKMMSAPSFLNNILWYGIAIDKDHAWYGLYSHFDSNKKITFKKVKRNKFLATKLTAEDFKNLAQFSKGYYILQKTEKGVIFNDLRFGFTGKDNFVFNFMAKNPEQRPFGTSINKDDLNQFFKRIFGK